MTEQTKETITINEVVHVVEDMSLDQKYMVSQLKDLQQKINNTTFALDQCKVATKAFTQALVADLAREKAEKDAPAEVEIAATPSGKEASNAFDKKKKDTF
jgi:hypothetical protein